MKTINEMTAIELCAEFEKILKPLGWHVGLTGGQLYGNAGGGGSLKDIDIIIYPHLGEKGKPVSSMTEDEIMNALHINGECTMEDYEGQTSGAVDYIWKGVLPDGRAIDIFFLT